MKYGALSLNQKPGNSSGPHVLPRKEERGKEINTNLIKRQDLGMVLIDQWKGGMTEKVNGNRGGIRKDESE